MIQSSGEEAAVPDTRLSLSDLVTRSHQRAEYLRRIADHVDRVAFALEAAPFLLRLYPEDYFEKNGEPSLQARLRRTASRPETTNLEVSQRLVWFLKDEKIKNLTELATVPAIGERVLKLQESRGDEYIGQLDRSGRHVIM